MVLKIASMFAAEEAGPVPIMMHTIVRQLLALPVVLVIRRHVMTTWCGDK
jgi:hypothetical protein